MYKVIVRFIDLKDENHVYNVGDTFPRVGKRVSDERINELKGTENKRGMALIAEDAPVEEEKKIAEEAPVVENVEPEAEAEAEVVEAPVEAEAEEAPKKTTKKTKK